MSFCKLRGTCYQVITISSPTLVIRIQKTKDQKTSCCQIVTNKFVQKKFIKKKSKVLDEGTLLFPK